MMLKNLFTIALAATTTLALGPVIDKNPGFEVAGATAAKSKYWTTPPACSRVTTGSSPAGKARLVCNLNTASANPVSFTQPLALTKNHYTVGAMVKFNLGPMAGMNMTISTDRGGLLYKTTGCGYAFNGQCYQSGGTWHTVGGDTVLFVGRADTEILKIAFDIFRPNGAATSGSVEIDQVLFRVGDQQ